MSVQEKVAHRLVPTYQEFEDALKDPNSKESQMLAACQAEMAFEKKLFIRFLRRHWENEIREAKLALDEAQHAAEKPVQQIQTQAKPTEAHQAAPEPTQAERQIEVGSLEVTLQNLLSTSLEGMSAQELAQHQAEVFSTIDRLVVEEIGPVVTTSSGAEVDISAIPEPRERRMDLVLKYNPGFADDLIAQGVFEQWKIFSKQATIFNYSFNKLGAIQNDPNNIKNNVSTKDTLEAVFTFDTNNNARMTPEVKQHNSDIIDKQAEFALIIIQQRSQLKPVSQNRVSVSKHPGFHAPKPAPGGVTQKEENEETHTYRRGNGNGKTH